MNKRQLKKSVMRNFSKLYDVALERDRFRRDVAIVCGRGARGQRTLTTMMIQSQRYEFSPYETMSISLEGYVVNRKVI
ncbi:hypothetical protein 3S14_3 [uncultured Caudovirales phage]|uniref:Uncharacterized protein n=1 Tax=uncultured Caudovirales phage TaxID=2100421 RepID=A0A2H4J2X9_9CAUD|nr:hypothetical protein 3S14_3 [uncultured Caudovirales phage]